MTGDGLCVTLPGNFGEMDAVCCGVSHIRETAMKELLQSLFDGGRVVRAFGYSLKGLRAAYTKESAFRQELILTVVLVPLALWLGRNGIERVLLIGSILLVLIVELLNSAVEATVDRGGKDWNTLAGRAKDMGSAAVLIALLLVAVTWGLIFWDRMGG
jgi:diacylglycerol kinase (ATP)